MKVVAVIPARYKSSRFPGKPLVLIDEKPMIWWVYKQASKVNVIDDVYVATDDERIYSVCIQYGMNVIMTSENHKTGTDRVAEVARQIKSDIYLNIQGDEPLLEPEVIESAIMPFLSDKNIQVTNLMTRIKDPVDLANPTVPKVIVNKNNEGIYLTRGITPFPKGALEYSFYKQVCVYGFNYSSLDFFSKTERGRVEKIEDIEILRFLENHINVKYVEVETESIAVDTEKDLIRVRKFLEKKGM